MNVGALNINSQLTFTYENVLMLRVTNIDANYADLS